MGKKAHGRDLADNEAKAVARNIHLQFSRKRIARDVRKCLESAIANAENNHDLDVDDLIVAEAHVGKGLVMKRFSPRARGRAGRIAKPFSHLTIVVRQVEAAA
jgi:large subunit ribosomal protein L22